MSDGVSWFSFIFSQWQWQWASFHVLIGYLCIFGEKSIQILNPFLSWVMCLLVIEFVRVLDLLWMQTPCRYMSCTSLLLLTLSWQCHLGHRGLWFLKSVFIWPHQLFVAVHSLCYPVTCGNLVPWPGFKPASPALEGGFLTSGPQGKSLLLLLLLLLLLSRFSYVQLCVTP